MALASVAAALTQYDTYIGDAFTSYSAAKFSLEAVNYLLVHRGSNASVPGRSISWQSMERVADRLSDFVQKNNPDAAALCARARVTGGGYGW